MSRIIRHSVGVDITNCYGTLLSSDFRLYRRFPKFGCIDTCRSTPLGSTCTYTCTTEYNDELETVTIELYKFSEHVVGIIEYSINHCKLDGSLINRAYISFDSFDCVLSPIGTNYFYGINDCIRYQDTLEVPTGHGIIVLSAGMMDAAVLSCLSGIAVMPYVSNKRGRPCTYSADNDKKRKHREQALKSYYKRKAERLAASSRYSGIVEGISSPETEAGAPCRVAPEFTARNAASM